MTAISGGMKGKQTEGLFIFLVLNVPSPHHYVAKIIKEILSEIKKKIHLNIDFLYSFSNIYPVSTGNQTAEILTDLVFLYLIFFSIFY